jgi:hypothetical protein
MKAIVLSLCLLSATGCFAKPYFRLQLGQSTILGISKQYDNASYRLAFGYEAPLSAQFSLLGEVGYNNGFNYDAGRASPINPARVQMHFGNRLDALTGVQYRLGRTVLAALVGVSSANVVNLGLDANSQDAMNKTLTEAGLRLGYQYNPNMIISVGMSQLFGNSGDLYYQDEDMNTIIEAVPSVMSLTAGVTLML